MISHLPALLGRRRIAALAIVPAAVAACAAAAGPVGPATLAARLGSVRGGETLVLAPGDYGHLVFPKRSWSPAITIDANAARFSRIDLKGVSGVTLRGGTVTGTGGRSYGVEIRDAHHVRVAGMTITGAHRGIVVATSSDIALERNRLSGLLSDGINIAYTQAALVQGNSCRDFLPTPGVYDAAGKRLRDGDHPDCIQAWSRPRFAPTADLRILDNEATGNMQGIFLGNHVRAGVDDGGFDRVVVRGNRIAIARPNGITVMGARGADVRDNVIRTLPGARMVNRPDRPVRAVLRIADSTGVTACNNRVDAAPDGIGTGRC